MIKSIEVNGFKSLLDFKLYLNHGLNILVGPNGSGKTNIISFFEFLGDLQNMDISNAICNSGGAGAIFTKIGEDRYNSTIYAVIRGQIPIRKERFLNYKYSFTLGLKTSDDAFGYHLQRLQIKFNDSPTFDEKKACDFDVETIFNDDEIIPKIHALDLRKLRIRSPFLRVRHDNLSKEEKIKQIVNFLSEPMRDQSSLVTQLQFLFYDIRNVVDDLKGGKIYNIIPSEAKLPEDSAQSPGINKNGSGLYATLYSMKRNEKYPNHVYRSRLRRIGVPFQLFKIEDLIKYIHLANEAIKYIDVFNDPFDNKIQVRIELQSKNENTVLPLSSMSDGTIKWISLIAILLSSRITFSIEEPENYLHPLMQAEIISVMRAKTKKNMFVILTTHSETILNNAEANEVIVVAFKDGKTVANRPLNAEILNEEIQKTGFGLGYYYLSGSLENA